MIFYIAGVYASNVHKGSSIYNFLDDAERAARDAVTNILESYHYIGKGLSVSRIRKDGAAVFLDSGAYSAMTKNAVIDLNEYCRFIKENHDIIRYASVLDSIGDPDGTWRNQKRMEDMGLSPLPCYHYGEPEEVLQYYVENYEYITIGGMVPISTAQLITWLNRLWGNYLTDKQGRPRVKVHGFGLTALTLVERYPWYSIDSATWVQAAFNGGIMLPQFGVLIAQAGHGVAKDFGKHIDTLPEEQREAVYAIIAESGFKIERIRNHYQSRWVFNLWAYKKRLDNLHSVDPRFVHLQPELF